MNFKKLLILFSCLSLLLLLVTPALAADQAGNPQGPLIRNLAFHDAEIKDILYLISKNTGVNIVLAEDTASNRNNIININNSNINNSNSCNNTKSNDSSSTKLTMNLHNVPLYSALDLITAASGLKYTKVGSSILVGNNNVVSKNYSTSITEKIKLNYADAYKVKDTLVALGLVDFNNIFVYGEKNKNDAISSTDKDYERINANKSGKKNDDDDSDDVDNLKASGIVKEELHFKEYDNAASIGANILVIRETPSNMHKIKEVIADIDQEATKILIEAKVIEINETGSKDLGLNWGAGDTTILKTTFFETPVGSSVRNAGIGKFLRSPLSFDVLLKAVVTNGNAKILSSPKVSTLEGKPAYIYVGDKVPYVSSITNNTTSTSNQITTEIHYLNAGITLEVLPNITDNDEIQLKIYSEISSIKEWKTFGKGNSAIDLPVPAMRQAETISRVKDNDTIIIGGLIYDEEKKTMSKLPILGDIPILKALFRWTNSSSSKKEVVISLTPHIVK